MLERNKVYSLSEFIAALNESQEFKAVKGKDVDSENKKNNKEVADLLKQTEKFDGGVKKEKKRENSRDTNDHNKTTLDAHFEFEPSNEYKERVKAQVHGFPSADNEKNSKIKDENGGVDFDGNIEFYKDRAEIRKEDDKEDELDKKAGLKNRVKAEKEPEAFKHKTLYKENKTMKRFHFKKTVFLTEDEMIKKIPDDVKIDGNKFLMKDAIGNEYLVECKRDTVIKDYIHTNVVRFRNEQQLKEDFNRMRYLAGYKGTDNVSRVDESSVSENNRVRQMLDETKKIIDKK